MKVKGKRIEYISSLFVQDSSSLIEDSLQSHCHLEYALSHLLVEYKDTEGFFVVLDSPYAFPAVHYFEIRREA